jgi:hypothetical protein
MSKSEKPEIFVDTYGRNAPNAARAGVGATTQADVEKATAARANLVNEQNDNAARGRPVRRD